MFLVLSCAMVYHCVTLIMTIMTTVTILVALSEAFMKDEDRLAPKTVDFWTSSASAAVSGPIESWPVWTA